MGKSLKEALLEQLDTLRERGLAPNEVPLEDEAPAVFVDARSTGSLELRGRPAKRPRVKGPASRPPAPKSFAPPVLAERNGAARREGDRDDDEQPRRDRRARPRGVGKGMLVQQPSAPLLPQPPIGGPAPARPAPHAPGRSALMQQRAEQRRRDQEQRQQVGAALAEIRLAPVDEDELAAFLKDLSVETGALPPLNVVVEALHAANSADIRAVGDQVRAYYRRPRRSEPPAPAPTPEPEPEPAVAQGV